MVLVRLAACSQHQNVPAEITHLTTIGDEPKVDKAVISQLE